MQGDKKSQQLLFILTQIDSGPEFVRGHICADFKKACGCMGANKSKFT